MSGRWVVDGQNDGDGEGGVSFEFVDAGEEDALDDEMLGDGVGHGVGNADGGCRFELPTRTAQAQMGMEMESLLSMPLLTSASAPAPAWDSGYGYVNGYGNGYGYDADTTYVPLSRAISGDSGNGMMLPESIDTTALFDTPSPTTTSFASSDTASPTSYSAPTIEADNVPRKALCRRRNSLAESFYSATLSDQTFVHPLSGLSMIMGYNTSLPKSRLDMYITALRQLVLSSCEQGLLKSEHQRAVSAEGVLWTVREAWPAAEGYWNLTATFRGFLGAELWRNFPCERTYRQLPAAYRPTRAQLLIPHAPMIDWLPWPDLRDLAIKYQDQLDVDALFRMAIHNVVAHRKQRRRSDATSPLAIEMPDVQDPVQDQTSFRVWDLVCLEKANGTDPLADPDLEKRPVPRSPGVKAVLRAYDLEYDDFDTQKLDDCFFEAFPALYCDTAASGWKVEGFPGLSVVDAGRPVSLTGPAVFRLKSRIESMVGGEINV